MGDLGHSISAKYSIYANTLIFKKQISMKYMLAICISLKDRWNSVVVVAALH